MNLKEIFESILVESPLKNLDKEAIADIKAELEELWDEVRANPDEFKRAVKDKSDWPIDWQDIYKFAKTHIKELKENLSESYRVETNEYERSHGKKPRGVGNWIIKVNGKEYNPRPSMSLTQAVKTAVSMAHKEGNKKEVDVVVPQP